MRISCGCRCPQHSRREISAAPHGLRKENLRHRKQIIHTDNRLRTRQRDDITITHITSSTNKLEEASAWPSTTSQEAQGWPHTMFLRIPRLCYVWSTRPLTLVHLNVPTCLSSVLSRPTTCPDANSSQLPVSLSSVPMVIKVVSRQASNSTFSNVQFLSFLTFFWSPSMTIELLYYFFHTHILSFLLPPCICRQVFFGHSCVKSQDAILHHNFHSKRSFTFSSIRRQKQHCDTGAPSQFSAFYLTFSY